MTWALQYAEHWPGSSATSGSIVMNNSAVYAANVAIDDVLIVYATGAGGGELHHRCNAVGNDAYRIPSAWCALQRWRRRLVLRLPLRLLDMGDVHPYIHHRLAESHRIIRSSLRLDELQKPVSHPTHLRRLSRIPGHPFGNLHGTVNGGGRLIQYRHRDGGEIRRRNSDRRSHGISWVRWNEPGDRGWDRGCG